MRPPYHFAALVAVLASSLLSACVTKQPPAESAYVVNSQGAVSPIARSALAGSTAPGKQEIIGLYIPFVGTGLAIKAGLEWDGTPTVIEVPVVNAPQSVMIPQTTTVQRTVMVPETRTVMVPKTVYEKQVTVPVPSDSPAKPQCPEPPISLTPACPAGDLMCPDGNACSVPTIVASR